MSQTVNTEASKLTHSPLPWNLHTFHTMSGETHALNCVGKSMCRRNWTCYLETAGGDSVAETYGATKEEAIANAEFVLRVITNHDVMVAALEALEPYLTDEAAMLDYASHNEGRAAGFDVASMKARSALSNVRAALAAAQETK